MYLAIVWIWYLVGMDRVRKNLKRGSGSQISNFADPGPGPNFRKSRVRVQRERPAGPRPMLKIPCFYYIVYIVIMDIYDLYREMLFWQLGKFSQLEFVCKSE